MGSRKSEVNQKITRRKFLEIISETYAGIIAFSLGIPLVDFLVGTVSKKKTESYSKVSPLDSIPENQPDNLSIVMAEEDTYIKRNQQEDVWIVKMADSKVTAYSPFCPHLGCRYQWNQDRKLFICPCHGSVFTLNGNVVAGPSPRPLDTLPTKVKNNYLYVLWERFKPGTAKKEIIS